MTLQEYINYISDYGTHVQFKYGDYIIQKMVHLTPYNSNFNYFPYKTSDGRKFHMEFEINGEKATIEECVGLVTSYERDRKLNELGI
jgi:hypothetical protein